MFSASSRSRGTRSGFTIIELLVAIGVTAILVSLMLTITLNVLNAWNRSSGKLSANATARLILDQLSLDLGAAVLRRDGNVWLAATIQRDPPAPADVSVTSNGNIATNDVDWASSLKPSGTVAAGSLLIDTSLIENARFGKSGVWLRLFVSQPDSNNGNLQNTSAVRAVGYQLVRRNLGSLSYPQYSYQLFRSEVRPHHSNAAGTGVQRSTFAIGYDFYDTTNPRGYNSSPTTANDEKDASNIRNPRDNQLIGNDVIDFGVRFYERNAAGLVEVFPVNKRDAVAPPTAAPFSYAATSNTGKTLANTGTQTYGFPTEAEVLVRVLTPEGARLIQAFEENASLFPGQTWWEIALKHSDVFTRRVEIKARAL